MAVNKVEYGDTTLIDLTSDTVTKETLLIGATAHTASGESISGEFDPEIYLRKSGGDTTNNIVTFTSGDSPSPTAWTDVNSLVTGEKHSSLLNKISTMIKNVRFLYKVLGTTDISTIGDGTVTGAVSTLNSSLAIGGFIKCLSIPIHITSNGSYLVNTVFFTGFESGELILSYIIQNVSTHSDAANFTVTFADNSHGQLVVQTRSDWVLPDIDLTLLVYYV